MSLQIGQHFGAYEILALLGKGGMGEVYRARDLKLRRDVAIKVLPSELSGDSDRVKRFQREAELLASLNHPHIGAIYYLEQSAGLRLLILELVEGEDLAERIARGPIPASEALGLAKDIAGALEAAHEKGIVHRDLKPANVKIRPDGVVKVLDFGLAKFTGDGTETDFSERPTAGVGTGTGVIVGTAAYMSPEHARGMEVDKRTDIWAFGCVLYEMLTGSVAFGRGSLTDTLAAIVDHEPDWTLLPRTTPAAVLRLLRRCLRKDLRQRLHDIADARLELEEVHLEGVPFQAQQSEMMRSPRRRFFPAVVLFLAGALLGGGIWSLRRPDATDQPLLRLGVTTPPVSDRDALFSFALSPDGRRLVFAATFEGTTQLWSRSLDQTTAEPLLGTEGAIHPFWAPDSRSIAFFADGLLKRLDLDGGRPQVLANARNPMGGAWNRDDVIVYSPFAASPLMAVAAIGGAAPYAATHLAPGERSHRLPSFLPDGRRFLFLVQFSESRVEGLHLGTLDAATKHQRLLPSDSAALYAPPGYLLFMRDGVLLADRFDATRGVPSGQPVAVATDVTWGFENRAAFSVSATGLLAHRSGDDVRRSSKVVWMDRGGTITAAPSWTAGFVQLAPDDGRVAAVGYVQANFDISIADGDLSRRFTFDSAIDIAPVWSPDGERLAFSSNRNGAFDLFLKSVGQAQEEQVLLASSDNKFPVDWSPDGSIILYVQQNTSGDDDLWALRLEDRVSFPFLQTPNTEDQGQFSPDGKWVAYRSNQSGRREIYVSPFPGPGAPQQVSTGGGIQPRWRRDGQELFYIGSDNQLMAVRIRLATKTVEVGAPIALFSMRLANRDNSQPGYDAARDGQRFLVNIDDNEPVTPPITIIQNWTAGLK